MGGCAYFMFGQWGADQALGTFVFILAFGWITSQDEARDRIENLQRQTNKLRGIDDLD